MNSATNVCFPYLNSECGPAVDPQLPALLKKTLTQRRHTDGDPERATKTEPICSCCNLIGQSVLEADLLQHAAFADYSAKKRNVPDLLSLSHSYAQILGRGHKMEQNKDGGLPSPSTSREIYKSRRNRGTYLFPKEIFGIKLSLKILKCYLLYQEL